MSSRAPSPSRNGESKSAINDFVAWAVCGSTKLEDAELDEDVDELEEVDEDDELVELLELVELDDEVELEEDVEVEVEELVDDVLVDEEPEDVEEDAELVELESDLLSSGSSTTFLERNSPSMHPEPLTILPAAKRQHSAQI
ncbi:MAG: hypothetical protein KDD44_09185 [Bdellovibrionales bacterium]|nr:hypothetical protein [Bdellovibrionales bacterium]